MKTFLELYCAARRCRAREFERRVFWSCLHRRAVLLALILRLGGSEYFRPDRELIAQAARVRTLAELEEELRDFVLSQRSGHWWRRRGHVRLSTQRIRRLARELLPAQRSGGRSAAPADRVRAA